MITTKLIEIKDDLLATFPFFEKGMIVNSLDANTWIDELYKYYFYLKVIQSRDARTYTILSDNSLACGWSLVSADVRLIAQIECSNPDIALAKLVHAVSAHSNRLLGADNNSEQIYVNETKDKYQRSLQLFQVDFRVAVPVNFTCADAIICEPCCEDESKA